MRGFQSFESFNLIESFKKMASKNTNTALESYTALSAPGNAGILKDAARRELGETEELKEECLRQLRKLIKDNKVMCITRDDFLLRFLRARKFNVQQSFHILRNYVKQRVAIHKLLLKLQPQTLKKFLSHDIISILPYRDDQERLVVYHRTGFWNVGLATTSEEDALMIIVLIMNYLAEKQSSQITGAVLVHDVKRIPLAQLPLALRYAGFLRNVFFMGKAADLSEFDKDQIVMARRVGQSIYETALLVEFSWSVEESLPIRYSKNHFVNESYLLKYVLRLLDPFIPKDIKDRMMFHGKSREALFQLVSPTILPDELGGNFGALSSDHLVEDICCFLRKMKDDQHYFLEQKV